MPQPNPPLLLLDNISKKFGNLIANDHITMDVRYGEIHALLGENGSGKTTLMNTLYGLYHPDEGRIFLKGKQVLIHSPHNAIKLRIGMVHQHFMLIPNLTVVENIILGSDSNKTFLDLRTASDSVIELGEKYGLRVNPKARVGDLPVGMQQRVEILKALYRGVELLILDEPTAVLTPLEVNDFFEVLKKLVDKGLSSIFISHKLEEVLEISHRITVLRRGVNIGTIPTEGATRQKLADMMVGHKVTLNAERPSSPPGKPILSIRDLSAKDSDGILTLKKINLTIRTGEILGIAGVDGNGQQPLVDILTGLSSCLSGEIFLSGEKTNRFSPHQIIQRGMSCVPSDRQKTGGIMEFTINENLILKCSDKKPYANNHVLQKKKIKQIGDRIVEQYDIRAENSEVIFKNLSGGNQQKVIFAREIESEPKILVACYPTRGLDIGATEYVHKCILEQRAKGVGILLISSELEEILSLSDRVAVIYSGEIMGILENNRQILNDIARMMLGERSAENV